MTNITFLSDKKQSFFELVQNASNDLKISSHNIYPRPYNKEAKRGKIKEFTIKSQRNAKFTFRSFSDQETCMVLTYPLDFLPNLTGRKIKKHINRFLQILKYHYENLTYNWVLEFTRNGNPHFHLTTNIKPVSIKDFREEVRAYWFKVVGTNNPLHLSQGVNQCDYIKSKGGVATYIAGYLSKENQKKVPPQFKESVGRFWGCSRSGKVTVSNELLIPDGYMVEKQNTFKACVRSASKFKSKLFKSLTLKNKFKCVGKIFAWLCSVLYYLPFSADKAYLMFYLKKPEFRYKHYSYKRKAGSGVYWGCGQELIDKIIVAHHIRTYDDIVPF